MNPMCNDADELNELEPIKYTYIYMFCITSNCRVVFILYQPFSFNTGFKRLLNVEVISNLFYLLLYTL